MWESFSRKLKVNCRITMSIKNQLRTQLRLQKIILLWETKFRTSGVLNTKMPFNRITSVYFYVENILSTIIGFSRETEPIGYICCCCWASHSCPTLCNPMDCSLPHFPVLHYPLEFVQTHVHWVNNAIQPSHPLLPASLPALSLSQHQRLFHWVNYLHQVATIWERQLQHQSFQRRIL